MNDIFLAVWKNVDRYTGEKASFRTWLTAVARYQVLSHIRDIRYHDYVSLDDVEPAGDSVGGRQADIHRAFLARKKL